MVVPVACCRGQGADFAGGKVNSVDADFVGLEVLDVFNAAIGRQNIRADYTFRKAVRPAAMYAAQAR